MIGDGSTSEPPAGPDASRHGPHPRAELEAGSDPKPDRQIADMAGPSALPRKNGELVFDSAWAARIFGMTVGLNQSQRLRWNEFRDRLIAEIAGAEGQGRESSYYERWFAAFERVLEDRGLVSRAELDARAVEFERGSRADVF